MRAANYQQLNLLKFWVFASKEMEPEDKWSNRIHAAHGRLVDSGTDSTGQWVHRQGSSYRQADGYGQIEGVTRRAYPCQKSLSSKLSNLRVDDMPQTTTFPLYRPFSLGRDIWRWDTCEGALTWTR